MLELRERHADVMSSDFVEAIQIPLGTLEDWMRTTPIHERTAAEAARPAR